MILIDTDIAIDLLRGQDAAFRWFAALPEIVTMTGYSAMELLNGCQNSKDLRHIQGFINDISLIWPSDRACTAGLEAFESVHLKNAIGILDMLIAQAAIEHDTPLHTLNHKHYKIVPHLLTVQPYKR
jgi:predicted nucleic acid-binding protein